MRYVFLCVALAVLTTGAAGDDAPPAIESIRNARQPDVNFASIQTAIEAAEPGDTIEIGPGQRDERIEITKAIKLVGAGPDKTTLGPTPRDEVYYAYLRTMKQKLLDMKFQFERGGKKPDKKKFEAEMEAIASRYIVPVVKIHDVDGVELRGMKLTLPSTPMKKSGRPDMTIVSAERSRLTIVDCAVVGSIDSGVRARDKSHLEIRDSLIAGTWGAGITVFDNRQGSLLIENCDVRNCHHNGIWTGPYSNPCVIRSSRISGSAYFGVRFGDDAMVVERCAIFDNARAGIYDESKRGTIRDNLFYHNHGVGIACWDKCEVVVRGNVFLDNFGPGLRANGACRPAIRDNVFVGSDVAVLFGPMNLPKEVREPLGEYNVTGNLFWRVQEPLAELRQKEGDGDQRLPIPWPPDSANQKRDPKISLLPDGMLHVADDSPLSGRDTSALRGIKVESRWPLTDEEKAMIPVDGTRDEEKWQEKPRDESLFLDLGRSQGFSAPAAQFS